MVVVGGRVRWGGGVRGVVKGVLVGSCWAGTGVLATSSTASPPTRQTFPQLMTVRQGGSSGEVEQLGAGTCLDEFFSTQGQQRL